MSVQVRGDVIKALRDQLGLTQEQFAKKCSLSDRTIKKAESNEGIYSGSARKIAEALGIEITQLLPPSSSSAEFAIYDTTANIIDKIHKLANFVDLVRRCDANSGQKTNLSPATQALLELAASLNGPFEPPKRQELAPAVYPVD